MSITSWLRGGVPAGRLDPARQQCLAAYDLVERLPRGSGRQAAWAAYALVTYGDKLSAAAGSTLDWETAEFASRLYAASAATLEPGAVPAPELPRWGSGPRTELQLHGMQETLVSLRTFVVYDAQRLPTSDVAARLPALDECASRAARLWAPRPTAELRGGIADTLLRGLDLAYAIGLDLAGTR